MAGCPICKKPVAPRRENATFPFCSERCRLIDLGKWLGEEYRIPEEEPKRPPADKRKDEAE